LFFYNYFVQTGKELLMIRYKRDQSMIIMVLWQDCLKNHTSMGGLEKITIKPYNPRKAITVNIIWLEVFFKN
ncbi:MAG: hypothetical protein JW969_13725, partial [Spirochaetales bacterium]|nr:hypothetical protein [Spirochaetales bacterium]